MKKCLVSIVVAVLAISASLFAQDNAEQKLPPGVDQKRLAKPVTPSRRPTDHSNMPPGARPGRDGMRNMQFRQMENMIENKKAEALKSIDELKEIKKLADMEKATKTAAAIQKIIERKQSELDAEIKMFQQRKQRIEEQMKKGQEQTKKPKGQITGASGKKPTSATDTDADPAKTSTVEPAQGRTSKTSGQATPKKDK